MAKGPPPEPLPIRFERRVNRDSDTGCWIWDGEQDGAGYGCMTIGCRTDQTNRKKRTHRIAYELYRGSIPDGLVIDHLCRNKICCNPWHLEVVPQRINNARSMSPTAHNLRKTHCKNGHELSGDNLLTNVKTGYRNCRICRTALTKKHNQLQRERLRANFALEGA